jgi:hypothetical protein
LRKICGPAYGNEHNMRITDNTELVESKYKSQDFFSVIKFRRTEWLGLIRTNEIRTVKRFLRRNCEEREEGVDLESGGLMMWKKI